MKKQLTWLPALLAAVLVVGCMSQKEPAEQAVATAEAALVPLRDNALKYAPDQLKALDAQVATMKDNLAKGDYKSVIDAVPSFNTSLGGLREAVTAKAQEAEAALAKAKEGWGPISKDVPKMVDAIQSRVDILSKSHHLPKGVTKDTLSSAKSGLDAMKSSWSDASSAATSGDFTSAMSKAEAVKEQATTIMKSLGMTSS